MVLQVVRKIVDDFYASDHVSVERGTFEDSESGRTGSVNDAATVWEDLNVFNFEDSTIVGLGDAGFLGHDHAEARRGGLQTATKHETVAWFKKMEDGWYAREA